MNYIQYEEILRYEMILLGSLAGFGALFFALMLWLDLRKQWKLPKHWRRKLNFRDYFCIACCIACIVAGSITVLNHNYDIKNQAYITYKGEFTYELSNKHYWIYIPDSNGIQLGVGVSGERWMPDGIYTGTVIYSERTKVVVDYFTDED